MMEGWIKLHRKMLDNPVICKDSDHVAVWSYLLLNATHREYPTIFGGQKITLKPGQLITGRKVISKQFRISESKVERILKRFQSEQQIEQQTSTSNRLISVISWDEYQGSEQPFEQQMDNDRTTSEQRVDTNKNVNNGKNGKNMVARSAPPKPLEERLKDFKLGLVPYLETYGQPMIKEFCDYWIEKSQNGKKMRFEMEKTFEVSLRLIKWKSKGQEFQRIRTKQSANPGKVQ